MPPLDLVAQETITWTEEAEERMARVPSFVQNMARMAILENWARKDPVAAEQAAEAAGMNSTENPSEPN